MAVDVTQLTDDTQLAVQALIEAAAKAGYTLRVRSAYRSCPEQHDLYSIGRGANDTRAIVTQVDGCRSAHTWGRAVDVDIMQGGALADGRGLDGDYDNLGPLGEELGFIWGGRWKGFRDQGHFQFHPGLSVQEALDRYCPDASDCAGALARSFADTARWMPAPNPVVTPPGEQPAATPPRSWLAIGAVTVLAAATTVAAWWWTHRRSPGGAAR
jgi:hypothetical protein